MSSLELRVILSQLRIYWVLLLAIVLAPLMSGCSQTSYRAETELLPDGRVKRTVMQTESLADEAGWKKKWFANFDWDVDIKEATPIDPSNNTGPGETAHTASGTFQSIKEIPKNYQFERTENGKKFTSRQILGGQVIDHGFVKEYLWEETITNVVTLNGIQKASRELFQHCMPMVEKALTTSKLKHYEWSPLIDWINSEGHDWLLESAVLYYEHSLEKNADSQALEDEFYKNCSKRGLNLNRGMTQKEKKEQIATFANSLLERLVKTENGSPITEEHRKYLLNGIVIEQEDEEKIEDDWDEHLKNVIESEYAGGNEAFSERMSELSIRILGIYFFTGERKFQYSAKVPGNIITANGNLESENEVLWNFSASDAYPKGYTMSVRSVAVTEGKLSQLLGRNALNSRKKIKEYLRLVSDLKNELKDGKPANLDRLFDNCRKTNSLRPLKLAGGLLSQQSEKKETGSKLQSLLKLIEESE